MHFRPSVNNTFTDKHRHFMTSRLLATLVAAALGCGALPAAHARTYVAPAASFGKGAYVHQFVLRDPVTHQPLPNARYRLFLPGQVIAGLPVKPDEHDSVIFGTTDAAGRTVRIRLPKFHPQKQWVFNPIIGEGDLGESFRLVSPSGKASLGSFPYVLDVENEYLACGYSDANGYTYYTQSRTPRNVSLYTGILTAPDDTDWCAGPGAAIANSAGDPGAPDLYTQYLGSLVANGNRLSDELRQQIITKLLALAIAERDTGRVAAVLDLGKIPDDRLNDIGYRLADAGIDVDRGLAMIDAHLAQSPDDAYALDSKGWALYRLGRNEEALTWFDRSIAIFSKDDDSDTHTAYATGLTHKGEVLWKLGRQDEARDAFAQARKVEPKNAELEETLKRLDVHAGADGAVSSGTTGT
ncbi:Predicted O-linked N-acetylglucosamine transferase, SPINDLY family,Tetratricopeptide repeat [Burkholderia stabilis]|uniref:Predicted O-linked N-acetylglucosamine transferase, SPINDLY family,Tetratricopeptide repeat n=2 Tax=Burkholderia stabilis TaxID=95485 RepID=A0AAJ5NKC9_9BURK|nr:Predicted O-linked N-acetylglucosamine transferase, SPINDLY family,Tetratricopeptide repeat [Burkholderia stabilis]